jgi:hypothetical protein
MVLIWTGSPACSHSKLPRKLRKRRGTFRSVRELIEAIVEYVEAHNEQAQGMFWKALPDDILAKVRRARAVLDKTPTA